MTAPELMTEVAKPDTTKSVLTSNHIVCLGMCPRCLGNLTASFQCVECKFDAAEIAAENVMLKDLRCEAAGLKILG
jgi:hypothetical protein